MFDESALGAYFEGMVREALLRTIRPMESRLRKSAQDDKWSFCLTTGTLCPAN